MNKSLPANLTKDQQIARYDKNFRNIPGTMIFTSVLKYETTSFIDLLTKLVSK